MAYDIISIGAHPDDVEVGTGGVLIRLARQGRKTGIIYLTAGEMGTGGDAQIRSREASEAAAKMGAVVFVMLVVTGMRAEIGASFLSKICADNW